MAISFGLQLAMDKGFRVVEVETDSLMAVKEISKNSSSFVSGVASSLIFVISLLLEIVVILDMLGGVVIILLII